MSAPYSGAPVENRGDGPVVIGVDVGGTKVLAAVVSASGTTSSVVERHTPGRLSTVEALDNAIDEAVLAAADGRAIAAVGLSAAGFVDGEGERVAFAPHLPWREAPVRERMSHRWGVPVALENDATCALEAEVAHGAARDRDSVVMVTVGTGIGGGLLVHGRVVRGASGMAGEYGHMTVMPGGRPCECGAQGCWEQYCSGRALARAAVAHLDAAGPLLRSLCRDDSAQVTGHMVLEAALQGEGVAVNAFAEVGAWLGAGLANLVAALDPEVIVIGGGVSASGDLLLTPARTELAARLVGGAHRTVPPLVAATTGPAAGAIGAAVLARRLI